MINLIQWKSSVIKECSTAYLKSISFVPVRLMGTEQVIVYSSPRTLHTEAGNSVMVAGISVTFNALLFITRPGGHHGLNS